MGKKTVITLITITILILTPITSTAESSSMNEFDSHVGRIIQQLTSLQHMGGNITSLIREVNHAVKLAEENNLDEAGKILDSVEENITRIKPMIEHNYKIHQLEKYTIVAFLLILPVIVYYGLPRLYLALWYRTHRKWIVEELRK